jgi:hypothetical protein
MATVTRHALQGCRDSGVLRTWVHVIFQEYPPGNGYSTGKAAAAAALTLLIRTGWGNRAPVTLQDVQRLRASLN